MPWGKSGEVKTHKSEGLAREGADWANSFDICLLTYRYSTSSSVAICIPSVSLRVRLLTQEWSLVLELDLVWCLVFLDLGSSLWIHLSKIIFRVCTYLSFALSSSPSAINR